MIEISFKDFYEYKYQDPVDNFFELYVMKNGFDDVLYIGISNQNIWNRWFGWNGHITFSNKFIGGESSVGRKIVDHLPDSWDWRIQLWTLEDCASFCKDILPSASNYPIQFLELLMIKKLSPVLNNNYNLNPGIDHMPKSEKEKIREAELDKAYKDVFEKKEK
jgi:hypothetical protein